MVVTVTVTWRVAVAPLHVAVSVYVVVLVGETIVLPGVATPPTVGSIETESAFVTAPQERFTAPPARIEVGFAVNDEMLGVPVHPVCGVGEIEVGARVDVCVGVRVGALTVIVT